MKASTAMTPRHTSLRLIASAALVAAATTTTPRPAQAQWFVFDAANFGQNIGGQDGSARVTVTRSKTDAEPRILYVGRAATAALKRIAPADPEPDARVFGIRSGRSVSNRIAAMAKAAGLGDGFSGHSPRVGMAQDLTAAGASLQALQVAGRWKSVRMPARYSAGERAARGAVAKYYRR